jgi:hypothetical protein
LRQNAQPLRRALYTCRYVLLPPEPVLPVEPVLPLEPL